MSKSEFYKKFGEQCVKESSSVITYSYNTVTDEDIAKFNINNYSEYKLEEF